MTHALVTQLRFARSELMRCLAGVTAEDALRRFQPMNCLSWIVGHVASQEQYFWVYLAQGKAAVPGLHRLVGFGRPATTPPWDEMMDAWQQITAAADPYLDTVSDDTLAQTLAHGNERAFEPVGLCLLRVTYHYWFHIGESHAIRQLLGHPDLPQFVGGMGAVAYGRGAA